jgi:hypothetical protein
MIRALWLRNKTYLSLTTFLIAAAFAAAAGHHFWRNEVRTLNEPVLPLLGFTSIESLDTALIRTADEYLILQNLFSPLFQSTDSGQIEGILVDSVEWQDNSLIVRMKSGLTTVDGHGIDARDAVFSLKRLMILQSNTHARLTDLFRECASLNSVDEDCTGVRLIDNLTFSLRPDNEKIWLLETLTSQDFGVIPRLSVDQKTLKIVDYRNTSGPYFVSESFSEHGFRVQAHDKHPLFEGREGFPKSALFKALVGRAAESLSRSFLEGSFTYYPKYFAPGASELAKIRSQEPDAVDEHSTQISFTRAIRFTARGMKELNQDERFRIGNTFFEALSAPYRRDGLLLSPLYTFYSESADGALRDDELARITASRGTEVLAEVKSLELGCLTGSKSILAPLVKHEKLELNIIEFDDIAANRVSSSDEVHEPHLYFVSTDSDPKAALSGVSNVISNLLFHTKQADADIWLKNFATEESRGIRNEMLRAVHRRALESGQLVPLYGFPASSVIRKPWSFSDFPKRVVVDALWLLKPSF